MTDLATATVVWSCVECPQGFHQVPASKAHLRGRCLEQLDRDLEDVEGAYADHGQAFIDAALSAPAPPMIVAGLLPAREIVAGFGPPRGRKTWFFGELMVSVATGTPALGDERFATASPAPVLYITNEDSPHNVAVRIRALLAARGLAVCPDHVHFRVRRGTWLDSIAAQDRVIAEAQREAYALVCLDPLRSLTSCVDKGPADLLPLGRFLRAFVAETRATLLLGHHTTKPAAVAGADPRPLPDRMSGGGLFSYIEAPLAIERVDETRSQVTPACWKHSPDPAPVMFQLETNDPQAPTWARLVGEVAGSSDAKETALQARILDHLHHNPGQSTNKVAAGVRAQKQAVIAALESLERIGRLDRLTGRKGGFEWFCISGSSGSGGGSEPVTDTGSLPIRENQSEPPVHRSRSVGNQ